MAEHKDLDNSQLHEPKDVSTASSGMVYVADGLGSGSWVRPTGWETHLDGTYTEASKRSISANSRVKILIDGLAYADGQGLATWDTATNKLVTEGSNYCYHVRLDFKATAVTSCLVDLEYAAGETLGDTILTRTLSVSKGASTTNSLVSSLELFTGPVVVANGGIEFYITPTENIDAWDFGIFITRSHAAY